MLKTILANIRAEYEDIRENMDDLRHAARHEGYGAARLDKAERRIQRLKNVLDWYKKR